jgi:hypothetical protein
MPAIAAAPAAGAITEAHARSARALPHLARVSSEEGRKHVSLPVVVLMPQRAPTPEPWFWSARCRWFAEGRRQVVENAGQDSASVVLRPRLMRAAPDSTT